MRMMLAIASTGCSSANESSPTPAAPALRAELSVATASHVGGCGSWNGFGVCTRSGNLSMSLSQLMRSRSTRRPRTRPPLAIAGASGRRSARRRRSAPSASNGRCPTRPGRGSSRRRSRPSPPRAPGAGTRAASARRRSRGGCSPWRVPDPRARPLTTGTPSGRRGSGARRTTRSGTRAGRRGGSPRTPRRRSVAPPGAGRTGAAGPTV